MTDLADFLLARIAEDEENSPNVSSWAGYVDWLSPEDWRRTEAEQDSWDRRWAAECEVKRQILEWYAGSDPEDQPVVRLLALPYADHPDYREEWKV